MRKRLIFAAGVGVGYVFGTRAGREKFDRMVARAHRIWESPTVQEAAGALQAQANHLFGEGKHALAGQLHKIGRSNRTRSTGLDGANARANSSAKSTSTDKATSTDEWDTSGQNQFHADAF